MAADSPPLDGQRQGMESLVNEGWHLKKWRYCWKMVGLTWTEVVQVLGIIPAMSWSVVRHTYPYTNEVIWYSKKFPVRYNVRSHCLHWKVVFSFHKNILFHKNRNRKRKLLLKNEEISGCKSQINTWKLNCYILTFFLNQERVNVCEHMIEMVPVRLPCVYLYIYIFFRSLHFSVRVSTFMCRMCLSEFTMNKSFKANY